MSILQKFARFIYQEHLDEFTRKNLRLLNEWKLPLLKHLGHLSEMELFEISKASNKEFLYSLENNTAIQNAVESLKRWEANELEIVSKEAIVPEDIVIVYAIQREAMLEFLPGFTDDVKTTLQLFKEMEHYYVEVNQIAWSSYTKIQKELILKKNKRINKEKTGRVSAEEKFRLLAETTREAIIIAGQQSNIIFWNKAASDIFQFRREEILGKPIADIMPERFRDKHHDGFNKFIATGQGSIIGQTIELTGLKKDGTEFPIELSLNYWKSNNEYFFSGIIRDITEKSKAKRQKELLYSVTRAISEASEFETALQDALNIICQTTGWPYGGAWLPANNNEYLRFSKATCYIDKTKYFVEYNKNITLKPDEGVPGRVWVKGKYEWVKDIDTSSDLKFLRKKAGLKTGLTSGFAVPIKEGNTVLAILEFYMFRNTSEDKELVELVSVIASQLGTAMQLKKAEMKLREAFEQLKFHSEDLERSNEELERFAYVASHDLQEPLRKVQSFSDVLYNKYSDKLDETAFNYIERMQNACGRMQKLIDDLLAFSRVGRTVETPAPVDLSKTIQDILQDLEPAIKEKDALIEVDELAVIEGNNGQLRQLFQNLISNAIKFSANDKRPEIKISGKIVKELPHEDADSDKKKFFKIEIQDNGIGFEQKYADKIFVIFQRLHAKSEYEGTGIGLAICRKIVEQHGGRIYANSQPGQGSVFTILLPVSQTEAKAPKQLMAEQH